MAASRRIPAVFLAALLLLCLTACKDKGEEAPRKIDFQPAPAYEVEYTVQLEQTGQFYGGCADESNFYFLAAEETGQLPGLYRVPLEGGEAERMEDYRLPEEGAFSTGGFWGPFMGGDGKLWVWEEYVLFYYDFPEDFDPNRDSMKDYLTGQDTFCHLRQLDPGTGRELKLLDIGTIPAEMTDRESLMGLAVDGKGIIYIATSKKITALNDEGETIFTLKAELAGDTDLALLPDGTAIALVSTPDGGREVRAIDPDAKGWGEVRYPVSDRVRSIVSGSGAYQFFCQRSNTLYGRLEGETLDTRLLNWEDAGVDPESDVMCFALLDGGRAAVLTRTFSNSETAVQSKLNFLLLAPSDKLPSDGKIRLVYGTIGDNSWARRRVNQFNKNNDQYYIELRDYAEGMLADHSAMDYIQIRDAAVTRLTAEIINGNIPDILDDQNIPLSALARQGVLTDLWPFIENDPELGRDAVMSHVLECAETDGKLFQVFSNFRIDTLAVSSTAAKDRTSWTLDEMLDAYGGKLPDFYNLIDAGMGSPHLLQKTPDSLLWDLLRMNLAHYVDWETGECFFDTEEFRNILRMCGGIAQNGDEMAHVQWGDQPVVYMRCLGSMADLTLDDAIFGGPEALMDYEALLAENGIRSSKINVDGEWVGIIDRWIGDAEQARSSGRLFNGAPAAADFVTGAVEHTGYAAYIGFPTEGGSGSSFRVDDCLGITEACADKDGAWQFVRQLLLPDGNLASQQQSLNVTYDAFPVNRADFEQLMEPQYFVDENGEYVLDRDGNRIEQAVSEFWLGDPAGMLVFLRSPTQEQAERFMALYQSIDHIMDENNALTDIITDQAQPYFAGDKSLDETADLIQRRVTLYVNENR